MSLYNPSRPEPWACPKPKTRTCIPDISSNSANMWVIRQVGMTDEDRGAEIPSYRDAVARDSHHKSNTQPQVQEMNLTNGPILGARWQARRRGKCLPCVSQKLRFVIPMNKLEIYRSLMKGHVMICEFIRGWPMDKGIIKCIQ